MRERNGCLMAVFASGRASRLTAQYNAIKSRIFGDHFSGVESGSPLHGDEEQGEDKGTIQVQRAALCALEDEDAPHIDLRVVVRPTDDPGAIRKRVPTTLLLFQETLVTFAQKPKPATLTRPSRSSSVLSDLKSRWTRLNTWSFTSPLSTSPVYSQETASLLKQ